VSALDLLVVCANVFCALNLVRLVPLLFAPSLATDNQRLLLAAVYLVSIVAVCYQAASILHRARLL
jgi:hypothetical protein